MAVAASFAFAAAAPAAGVPVEAGGAGLPFSVLDLAFIAGGALFLLLAGLWLLYALRPVAPEPVRVAPRRARSPEPVIARR